jgi:hypothetical protein
MAVSKAFQEEGLVLPFEDATFDAALQNDVSTHLAGYAVGSHAAITLFLLDGPFGRQIVDSGLTDGAAVESLKASVSEWGEHPDAFFANVHVEVIGWKPR